MSAINYALTTEQRVKDNLAMTGSTADTIIKRYIYGATEFMQKYCSLKRFARTTYTDELYNGSFRNSDKLNNILILRNGVGLVSVTNVKYNAGTQATPSWVTFNASDYTVDFQTGIIDISGTFPAGISNISVTYVAGYLIDFTNEFDDTLHTLPYELTDLCERLVTKRLKKRDSEGKSTETFNGSTTTWGAFLDDADKTVLANYSRAHII